MPNIAFEYLGPDIDDATAQLRATQLSNFMRHEVHGPVYEDEFGLRRIDPDPPSGTPGDIPWRVEAMRQNHTVQPDGSYREYVIAIDCDGQGRPSDHPLAIAGLLVATKPQGLCTKQAHMPTHIAEIDVARRMYGKKLAPSLLAMLCETHAEDQRIDAKAYEHNERSQRFLRKLGLTIDDTAQPEAGKVYEGTWITMHTFAARLAALLL